MITQKKTDAERRNTTASFKVHCETEDIEAFKLASEREDFASMSAWMLWHLRKIARKNKPPAMPPSKGKDAPCN